MLGSLILYFKGMRRMMFQLSGFYCKTLTAKNRSPKPKDPEQALNSRPQALNPEPRTLNTKTRSHYRGRNSYLYYFGGSLLFLLLQFNWPSKP